jgi:hypothetical protein
VSDVRDFAPIAAGVRIWRPAGPSKATPTRTSRADAAAHSDATRIQAVARPARRDTNGNFPESILV